MSGTTVAADRCEGCGSARLARTRIEQLVECGDALVGGMVPARRCKTCGKVAVADETLRAFEESAAAFAGARSADSSGPFEMWRAPETVTLAPRRAVTKLRRARWVA